MTNSSINKNSASYATHKEGVRAGCKWSWLEFIREHPDHALGSSLLWARIRAIVTLTLLSVAATIPDSGGCFELFGYDVMVDDALRPWLLEVNCSPALGCDEPADREVKEPLVADLVDLLDRQRAEVGAALPVGGGARAAKARAGRMGLVRREGGGHGGSSGSSSGGGSGGSSGGANGTHGANGASKPGPSRGSASGGRGGGDDGGGGCLGGSPLHSGGYDLIFPFNAATARLSAEVGGHEGQIVSEVRQQLAALSATAGDAANGAAAHGAESEAQAEAEAGVRSLGRSTGKVAASGGPAEVVTTGSGAGAGTGAGASAPSGADAGASGAHVRSSSARRAVRPTGTFAARASQSWRGMTTEGSEGFARMLTQAPRAGEELARRARLRAAMPVR